MSLPEWLVAKLAADNPDGYTRAARIGTCPHCRARVLRGLDDERCALAVDVTPVELDHYGEYLALARGLRTYYLTRRMSVSGSSRWEIDPRYPAMIERKERRYAVIPEHRCFIWLPTVTDGMLANTRKPAATPTDTPPF